MKIKHSSWETTVKCVYNWDWKEKIREKISLSLERSSGHGANSENGNVVFTIWCYLLYNSKMQKVRTEI